MARCEHCGAELRPLVVEFGGRSMELPCSEPCRCEGARRAREDAEAREQERRGREQAERRARRARKAGIPERYLDAASNYARRAWSLVEQGRGLYIVGGVGCGKTQLACGVLGCALDAGRRVKFASAPAIFSAIRSTYNGGGSEEEVVGCFLRPDVLVIDDLGMETPTEWTLMQLFRIVDERYSQRRPLVVTTQFDYDALAARLARRGDEATARAILSRLRGSCGRIAISGGDLRCESADR